MHEMLINILWSLGTIAFACIALGFISESIIDFILNDRPILYVIFTICYWGFVFVLVLTYWI